MTSNVFIQTKFCNSCSTEKPTSEFSKSKSKHDGLQSKCKSCCNSICKDWRAENKERLHQYNKTWRDANSGKRTASESKRRATKLKATPSWCEHEQIEILYTQCSTLSEQTGIEHHVDHIVPLQSKIVCGLHCLANLRIIPATENLSKKNLLWPDMP